jgi:hypothetical protein
MSLQLELLLQYIQLKASSAELDCIINGARIARENQSKRIDKQLSDEYRNLYSSWFDNYDYEGKFHITDYFHFEIGDTDYELAIFSADVEVRLVNDYDSKCRLEIGYNSDGNHETCVRDGCDKFDPITRDPRNIIYLLSYITEVHNKIKAREVEHAKARLE